MWLHSYLWRCLRTLCFRTCCTLLRFDKQKSGSEIDQSSVYVVYCRGHHKWKNKRLTFVICCQDSQDYNKMWVTLRSVILFNPGTIYCVFSPLKEGFRAHHFIELSENITLCLGLNLQHFRCKTSSTLFHTHILYICMLYCAAQFSVCCRFTWFSLCPVTMLLCCLCYCNNVM